MILNGDNQNNHCWLNVDLKFYENLGGNERSLFISMFYGYEGFNDRAQKVGFLFVIPSYDVHKSTNVIN